MNTAGNISLGAARAAFILCFVCGCALRYDNVSNDPEYKSLLNARYELTTNMLIQGVNLPPGYGADVDIYKIRPTWPKVIGREIITEGVLTPGTTLEVLSIRKSVNHLPGYQSIQAVVGISPLVKTSEVPVVIGLKYVQSTNYMLKRNAE